MKAAVAYLEPHMERVEGQEKGTIVLATVKGDVHDIGKNLVDIILTNNGYKVVNLGIKVPLADIVDRGARSTRRMPSACPGLLVKSTVVMRENLEEMSRQGLDMPVLLGGAALTRNYVEDDCVQAYACGRVAYARDAFDGLHLMDKVMGNGFDDYLGRAAGQARRARRRTRSARWARPIRAASRPVDVTYAQDAPPPRDRRTSRCPTPPFWGARVMEAGAEGAGALHQRAQPLPVPVGLPEAGPQSLDDFLGWAKQELRPVLQAHAGADRGAGDPQAAGDLRLLEMRGPGQRPVLFEQDGITEACRFTLPRQPKEDGECIADFVRDIDDAASAT